MSAADRVRADRAAQGLPERLTDPTVVDRVLAVLLAGNGADLLTPAREGARHG